MPDDPQTKKTPTEAKRKPRGSARIWNATDIARMTRITNLDVANAARWWRKHAVPRYRKILDARLKESDDEQSDASE